MDKSRSEPDVEPARDGRNGRMKSKKGGRSEELRDSQEKRPEGFTRRSKLVREEGTQRLSRQCYTVTKPSEMAKASGTPNNLIVTWLAVGTRTFRARRSAHERRAWARCARERITSALPGEAAAGGGGLTSMCWCRTSRMQARRCSLRLQSRQSSGADPTRSGCSSTLTWRGFVVALPFH